MEKAMEQTARINLENDEVAVLDAASHIFAAFICANQCTRDNQEAVLQNAVELAIRMAKMVDERVSAGVEMRSGLQNDPNYRPLG